MKGYILDIEKETLENTDYRRVLYTGRYSQLVLMCVKPGDEIGNEKHGVDQFIRIEQGGAKLVLNNEYEREVQTGDAFVVPAGTWHNVINVGKEDLKLYTVYSPPNHKDGVVEKTKADEVEEHFEGKTTE